MKLRSNQFFPLAEKGMADKALQRNMAVFRDLIPAAREKAVARLEDYPSKRQELKRVKNATLDKLPQYLEQFEQNLLRNGGQIHWAETADDLNRTVIDICRTANAKNIVKGKSMVSEETGLLTALTQAGLNTVETDLGEYIIQLAEEPPSHIIGPAIHKTFEQVVDLFKQHHNLRERELDSVKKVMAEARSVLRDKFLTADVGITGANYLVANTGTVGLVTNEGNGDLCSTLPKIHIVVTSIEKVVPDMNAAMAIQRALVPNATAQAITCYTSFFTGKGGRNGDTGPEQFHVVLLDNGRSNILHSEYKDILRCIRCSACLNHCPIYTRTGGHAYGWVYPGPMGSVWTPLLQMQNGRGLQDTHHLPNACTTCGRCEEVCPVDIPLPDMLRNLRAEEQKQGLQAIRWVWGMKIFMTLLQRPTLFHFVTGIGVSILRRFGKQRGAFASLLLANGWTQVRDLPAPEGDTFFKQLRTRKRDGE
jgi:L-lactate dehydrogenase complex protein LldF